MEPLVRGVPDEIQTFLAFVVGKELRAQRLLVKCRQRNVNALLPDRCGGKVFAKGEYLKCDQRYVREKRRTRTNHSRRRIDDKSETLNLRKASHVRRIRKITRLGNLCCFTRRRHPAADDSHPAGVRARGD